MSPTIRADGVVVGTPERDVIVTGHGNDRVIGFGGDDVICTNGGDDVVDAGAGVDFVDAGAGYDFCTAGEAVLGCEDDVLVGAVVPSFLDLDDDGVHDEVEQRYGSSNTSNDTDGDGLSDRFEIERGGSSHLPDRTDSDGDSVPDGTEDVDADGLDAEREQQLGSDPLTDDTDDDGLLDPDEIVRGTGIDNADTDGDGIDDGTEVASGLDPLDADTDGDGVADLDEDRTVEAASAAGNAQVQVTAPGLFDGAIEVESLDEPELLDGAGQVGVPIEVDLGAYDQSQITGATISLEYPAGTTPAAAEDLRILTWDEELQGWVPPSPLEQQTVDTVAGTVTATVPHFSTFALFDMVALEAFWAGANRLCQALPGDPVATSLDLAVVIDTSGSMSSSDPQRRRVTESRRIVEALRPDDRTAVIGFSSSASVRYPLGNDRAAALAAVDQLGGSSGGTNIGGGVSSGLAQLSGEEADRSEVILLFTDGQGSYSPSITDAAVADDVRIYTVGLGSGVDDVLLGEIASATGGTYYPIDSAEEIFLAFQAILAGSDDTRDSDSDGLTDCEEQRGMPSARGKVYTSDPLVADTDGDGLDDGYEVGEKRRTSLFPFFFSQTYFYDVLSDPSVANTDRDPDNAEPTKLDDWQEVANNSSPRRIDTDGDGADDGMEWYIGTDPASDDTDGDGIEDLEEIIDPELLWLDPLAHDDVVTREEYLRLYGKGLACGDLETYCFADEDEVRTVPYLIGAIVSGFVPVAGDARDLIGSAINGDLVGFGLNIVAVIPVVGDSARAVAKVIRTISKLPADQTARLLAIVRRLPGVPPQKADDIVEGVLEGPLEVLRRGGKLSDSGADELIAAGVDMKKLARIVEGAADVRRAPGDGFLTPKASEQYLREAGFKDRGHTLFRDPNNRRDRTGSRVVDAWKDRPPLAIAREAKSGSQSLNSRTQGQIDKDVRLRSEDRIDVVEWHFFPSEASRKIADDERLFDALSDAGIPYVIHLP